MTETALSFSFRCRTSLAVQVDVDTTGIILNVEQPGSTIRDRDNSLEVHWITQLCLPGSQLSNLLNSSKNRKLWPLCSQNTRENYSA